MNGSKPTVGLAMVCDANGTIIRVISNTLGLGRDNLEGKTFSLVVDRGSFTKALDFMLAANREGGVFDWELGVPFREGVKILHFAGAVSEGNVVVVGANTTEHMEQLLNDFMHMWNEQANRLRTTTKDNIKLSNEAQARESGLYDELGRLNNELANLQRELVKKNMALERLNQEKNRFLGIAAHDLRNPLNAIQIYSEFLQEEAANVLNEEQMEFVSIIHDSSQFMLRLVNDLLDVAKIESGKLELDIEPLDLAPLVEANVKLNAALASRKNVQVQLHARVTSLFVEADRAKVEQVLNNLLSNAVKFSPPDSSVSVTLEECEGHARIAVQDHGQGIPPDELDRLFRPFQKTSVQSTAGEQSTGLGLAIVQKIVQGHEGKVWVDSEVGKGSTFVVELPVLERPSHD
jgi:signal transduction histidine kinase